MIHQTVVLVVGSCPAGLANALAVARAGVEVTLLERFSCNITVVGVKTKPQTHKDQPLREWEVETDDKKTSYFRPFLANHLIKRCTPLRR